VPLIGDHPIICGVIKRRNPVQQCQWRYSSYNNKYNVNEIYTYWTTGLDIVVARSSYFTKWTIPAHTYQSTRKLCCLLLFELYLSLTVPSLHMLLVILSNIHTSTCYVQRKQDRLYTLYTCRGLPCYCLILYWYTEYSFHHNRKNE
jgi:hypothetical protein